ncbi:hypothetical protein [Neorhizobium sp. IRS_2294]|uniref:hypothetical protein n=1 Tax=unclassified Neorhizobium TaxID=2629175 RepID=UPI003D29D71B
MAGLKISFETDELRDCCCKFERGLEILGVHVARTLFTMIADAEALNNAAEWHEFLVYDLITSGPMAFHVGVGSEYIAVFVPVGKKFAISDSGQTNWSSVTRVMLTTLQRRN